MWLLLLTYTNLFCVLILQVLKGQTREIWRAADDDLLDS